MNKLYIFWVAAIFAIASSSAVSGAAPLSDFNNGDLTGTFSNTWSGALIQNGTFASIGSPATDFGDYRSLTFSAIDITGLANVSITARLDLGNTATGFTVNLISGSGNASASAYFDASLFNTSNFVTVSTAWVDNGSFNPASLRAWQITGGSPSSTTNFRVSFDSLSVSAIPEPSTFAALIGLASLGFCAVRRRRRG
jgi:hypothetical protein